MIIELTLYKDGSSFHENKPALFSIEGIVVITPTIKGCTKLTFPSHGTNAGRSSWIVQESYDEVKELIIGGE
jgi:hypothetical protein